MALFVSRTVRRRLAAAGGAGHAPAAAGAARAREIAGRLAGDGVTGGELHALGLYEEAMRRLVERLLLGAAADAGESLLDRLLDELREQVGEEALAALLRAFEAEYLAEGGLEIDLGATAPAAAHAGERAAGREAPSGRGARTRRAAEGGEREGAGSRPAPGAPTAVGPPWPAAGGERAVLRELVVFWAVGANLASSPTVERLRDSPLLAERAFETLTRRLGALLAREPGRGEGEPTLLDSLLSPPAVSRVSAADQLEYLAGRRPELVADRVPAWRTAVDLVREERAPRFAPGPPPGPAAVELPAYGPPEDEPARYAADQPWMETVVLVAKNALVWLYQLSEAHGRPIERLDEVPEKELAELAARGFNALWLIGLWERSPASREIKRRCGNPQAEASAYAVRRYEIAAALGGEEALDGLREKAARHGIRLAADMVPNHAGIDSDWMFEAPERFLAVEGCPFPNYRFTGPDLSDLPEMTLQLEDGYYDRSDAAVVFRRIDRRRGRTDYVYHGNDGTGLPWNDTAQLDHTRPEVRRAVVEAVLQVARRFPIIRFDAAMTLTRLHYQRLWYPEPGAGGAIPSRAEHGLSRAEFEERMPEELWRQVAERIAAELPGTLLLAEAFWLMESYFVRSLGVHRAYNSAFMNTLRGHDTARFRRLVRETLAFDPELLRRQVNFLSNPDEAPAVERFGAGDRYFGVCALLATLPGLPMFGHGQFEGLSERYGMEYARSYREEPADPRVLRRHRREITPLLRRRDLFAGVERFRWFDAEAEGKTQESVVAFANGKGKERVLVLYQDAAERVHALLRDSAPFAVWDRAGEDGAPKARLEREGWRAALGVELPPGAILRCRDLVRGRRHFYPADELARHGFPVQLEGYECRVLTGFEVVEAGRARARSGKAARRARRPAQDGGAGRGATSPEAGRPKTDAAASKGVDPKGPGTARPAAADAALPAPPGDAARPTAPPSDAAAEGPTAEEAGRDRPASPVRRSGRAGSSRTGAPSSPEDPAPEDGTAGRRPRR